MAGGEARPGDDAREVCLEVLQLRLGKVQRPGEHTVTSRVTDVNGEVQPTAEDLEVKKTFLEHNAQLPRTVIIA